MLFLFTLNPHIYIKSNFIWRKQRWKFEVNKTRLSKHFAWLKIMTLRAFRLVFVHQVRFIDLEFVCVHNATVSQSRLWGPAFNLSPMILKSKRISGRNDLASIRRYSSWSNRPTGWYTVGRKFLYEIKNFCW